MIRFLLGVCSIILFLILLDSCNGEVKCDCWTDSVKVSRILHPDGTAGKDAMIESLRPDKNSGKDTYLSVFTWTTDGDFNTARSFIQFNFSGIAPETKIRRAVLSLYFSVYDNLQEQTGDNAFFISPVLENWSEDLITWNNQPKCDTLQKIVVPKSTSANQSYSIDVTGFVQHMIDSPEANHGFMIRLNDEFPYRLVILGSGNHPDNSKRPELVIYY